MALLLQFSLWEWRRKFGIVKQTRFSALFFIPFFQGFHNHSKQEKIQVFIMGLDHVKKEIIDQAEEEAKHIVTAAKEQTKKDIDAAHGIADAFEAEVDAALKKELDSLDKRYYASMQLLSKKILLQKKKKILEELFQEFSDSLLKMPKVEKTKTLQILVDCAKKQCSIGKIYCASQDLSIVKGLFSVVEQKPLIGGIVAESKDGNYRFDYSFDTMLTQLQERKLQEVYSLLFS